MKKIIITILTLIISYFAIGQNKRLLVAGSSTDEIYTIQYHSDGYSPVRMGIRQTSTDTLNLSGTKYKYIKIDGKTYEIKRTTELGEVQPTFTTIFRISGDTLSTYRYKYLKEVRKIDSITGFKGKQKVDNSEKFRIKHSDTASMLMYSPYYTATLTDRQRNIVDSLTRLKITEYSHIEINFEAMYMKGTKTKKYWQKRGNAIAILNYEIYNTKKGHGFRLINETEIK